VCVSVSVNDTREQNVEWLNSLRRHFGEADMRDPNEPCIKWGFVWAPSVE